MASPGTFDPIGGSYDAQTGKSFEKRLYYQMRSRSIVGALAKAGAPNVATLQAGGDALPIDNSAAILRKKLTDTDLLRFTLQEDAVGLPSYGDLDVERGDYIKYQNLECRVNQIDSPAIPVQGKNARRRAKKSITDIPGQAQKAAIKYMQEQYEFEYLISLIYGGSPSALKDESEGGLGLKLGVNDSGTAGKPLLPRHFANSYLDNGYLSNYSTTPATWNSTVNDAINNITPGTNGVVDLTNIKYHRRQLDKINFAGISLGGKKYKAVWLCDPDIWYRIDHILADYYKGARERSANNPLFSADYQLVYKDMLFLNVPTLEKLRPSYDSGNACPSIGVGDASNVLKTDPRGFSTNSNNAWMIGLGEFSSAEGYDDQISITEEKGRHGKGLEYAAHMDSAFVRTEWYAKDGSTDSDAVRSHSVYAACFYEPGVGTNY